MSKKNELKYKIARCFFGLIMFLIGVKGMIDYTQASQLLAGSIKDFNSAEGLINEIKFDFLGENGNYYLKKILSCQYLEDNADEIIIFLNAQLALGGILCVFGHTFSKFMIISSIVFDLIFIHNLRFFASDNSKGLMLKYLAFIGGALHIL